jgi:transcriptional regulator with XRE-family HTH domain
MTASSRAAAPKRAKPRREADPEALELGQKIRDLRQARKMTAVALAEAVGVSQSLISQVERGLAAPSITTLRGIARALHVPMSALFLGPHDATADERDRYGRQLVVRRNHRKRIAKSGTGVDFQLLSPDVQRSIEFLEITIEPGHSSPAEPGAYVTHDGEECHVCISGVVTFYIDGQRFDLQQGDSIYFDCTLPHRTENNSDRPAVLVAATSPPNS